MSKKVKVKVEDSSDRSELEFESSSDEAGSTPKRRMVTRMSTMSTTSDSDTEDESAEKQEINEGTSGADEPIALRFCWVCHYEGADHLCQTCPRAFHPQCIKNFNKKRILEGNKLERCQECCVTNVTAFPQFKSLSKDKLALILTASYATAWNGWVKEGSRRSGEEGRNWSNVLDGIQNVRNVGSKELQDMQKTLVKVVSMKSIQEGITNGEIRTLEGFVAEIKWLYHNSVIFNGRCSTQTSALRWFLCNTFSALNKMVWDCVECQLYKATKPKDRPTGFFMTLCKIPHPVIWAKQVGFPHWPAKMISSNTNDGSLNVFFFGDHTHCTLKLTDCLAYSTVHPTDRGRDRKNAKLKAAVKEANEFIEILGRNPLIGPQILEANASPLPNLTSEYIKKIFPKMQPSMLKGMLHPTSTEFDLDVDE